MDSDEQRQQQFLLLVDLVNVTVDDCGLNSLDTDCAVVVDRSLSVDSSPRLPVLDVDEQDHAFVFKEPDAVLLHTSSGNRAKQSDDNDCSNPPQNLSKEAAAPPTSFSASVTDLYMLPDVGASSTQTNASHRIPIAVFNDPADSFYVDHLPGFSGGADYCISRVSSHSCFNIRDIEIEGVKLPESVIEAQVVQLFSNCMVPLERMTWAELELLLSGAELDAIIRGPTVQDTYVVCSMCGANVLDHLDGRLEHALIFHNEENMLFRFKCLQPHCEFKTQDWEVLEQHLNSRHPRVPWKYRDILSTKSEACSTIWRLHLLCFPDSKRTGRIKRPQLKNSRNHASKPTARKSSCSTRGTQQKNSLTRRRRKPSALKTKTKRSEKQSSASHADADVAAAGICALCGEEFLDTANTQQNLGTDSSRLDHVFLSHNSETGVEYEIFRFKCFQSDCEFKAHTWASMDAHFSAQHGVEPLKFSDVMNKTGHHSDSARIWEVYAQCFPPVVNKAKDATSRQHSKQLVVKKKKSAKASFPPSRYEKGGPSSEKNSVVMPEPIVITLSSSSSDEEADDSSSLRPYSSSSSSCCCLEVESEPNIYTNNQGGISRSAVIEVEDLAQEESGSSQPGSSRGNRIALKPERSRNFGTLQCVLKTGRRSSAVSKRKAATMVDDRQEPEEEPILSKLSKFFAAAAMNNASSNFTAIATAKNEMDTDFTVQRSVVDVTSSASLHGLVEQPEVRTGVGPQSDAVQLRNTFFKLPKNSVILSKNSDQI